MKPCPDICFGCGKLESSGTEMLFGGGKLEGSVTAIIIRMEVARISNQEIMKIPQTMLALSQPKVIGIWFTSA